ncbi:aminodeoxychorismate synthase component I [Altererythrobacter aurantiacus]|uniref:Probable branched-chain-amino-acid aminotransferase n=1 Tax=Parapontixanthobacter aurantiacus TaxID=1463599 RepID=A0A844ZLZ4_9SPHN|nr:aminodeoxychorismate synthase component I [Parapontixanthobacter aurantiacus]MXO86689.1 aminodeoxychorismate synthase component I [Parapontixanthobacter aurantiacus]
MPVTTPMVLLDDARSARASDALFYSDPERVFVARRPDEVASVLAQADEALAKQGGSLAGYISYEAGLALEERLRPLAEKRTGGAGPLVWLGLFAEPERIPAAQMQDWLFARCDHDAILPSVGPLEPQISMGAYRENVARLQDAIRTGEIYQANLTFPLVGGYTGDPVALYRALRPPSEAGYGGLIFDGTHWILSLSPELFVSLKDRQIKAKPMKGTRPRSQDPEADEAMRQELAASEKDRAENLMIVDLLRNDLSRVAHAGSVEVTDAFSVESYPTVHQMVTTVHADLEQGTSALDLVRALFPCGSITGAPKIRAMELIAEVERDARGPYCGAIGRIDAAQDGKGQSAAFNVAIRTLRLTPVENHRGKAVLGVGSAILADSDPLTEWRECLVKGEFARASSPEFCAPHVDLIETMRFDPDVGIANLQMHLDRMKESATQLGIAFDRHEGRNQIQALSFDLDEPCRIRLLAGRPGTMALEARPLSEAREWPDPVKCIVLPLPVDPNDWRLRHKTSDRGFYDEARQIAEDCGAQEALFVREDGLLTEGSITNLFVRGEDDVLGTPPTRLGLLPGILRRSLIEKGEAREQEVRIEDLADGFFLGNALRGLMRARLMTS